MNMIKGTSFLLLFLICGCSLLRSYNERTFRFNYDGDDYEIVSKVQGDEVLENVLLRHSDREEVVLEAIDENSDGELDELRLGGLTLAEANRIYYIGIEQALESGNLDSKNELRVFEFSDSNQTYKIETVGYNDYTSRRRMVYGYLKEVVVFNRFTIIQNEDGTEIVMRDMDANGILDNTVTPEDLDLSDYHDIYRDILDKGLSSDKIIIREQMYIILPVERI